MYLKSSRFRRIWRRVLARFAAVRASCLRFIKRLRCGLAQSASACGYRGLARDGEPTRPVPRSLSRISVDGQAVKQLQTLKIGDRARRLAARRITLEPACARGVCLAYVEVLIGPGDRKAVQPTGTRRRWSGRTVCELSGCTPVASGRACNCQASFGRIPRKLRSDWDVISFGSSRPVLARILFATLRRMMRWAVNQGDLERSPMEGMDHDLVHNVHAFGISKYVENVARN